jgi:hypothetical protein
MRILGSKHGAFFYVRALVHIYERSRGFCHSVIWNPMIPRIRNMAEQLYHAFTVIPRMRYRVVVYAEQRVEDRWVEMSSTELATFARPNREPRMPTRPPPPPPPPAAAAADDQVVPQGPPEQSSTPPEQSAEPNTDAPGAMRTQRRAQEARVAGQRRSPPPRPSRAPLARGPPLAYQMMVPAWAVLANDIWFDCPMCTEAIAHSGVVCGQCGGRPACCDVLYPWSLADRARGDAPSADTRAHSRKKDQTALFRANQTALLRVTHIF